MPAIPPHSSFAAKNYNIPSSPRSHRDALDTLHTKYQTISEELALRNNPQATEYHIKLKNGILHTKARNYDTLNSTLHSPHFAKLSSLHGKSIPSLIVQQSTRKKLIEVINDNSFIVHPDIAPQVTTAIDEFLNSRAPFFQPNTTMSLGWIDEITQITAISSKLEGVKSGASFPIQTRIKDVKWKDQEKNIEGVLDHIQYSGKELVVIISTNSTDHHFHYRPPPTTPHRQNPSKKILHHPLSDILMHFTIPHQPDITTTAPQLLTTNINTLKEIQTSINSNMSQP